VACSDVVVCSVFRENVADGDLDTSGCAHWRFFFAGHEETVGDFCVTDSESSFLL